MAAPNKAERQKCWAARDAFWKCLEESADNPTKCKTQRNVFEKSCSAQWASFVFFRSLCTVYGTHFRANDSCLFN